MKTFAPRNQQQVSPPKLNAFASGSHRQFIFLIVYLFWQKGLHFASVLVTTATIKLSLQSFEVAQVVQVLQDGISRLALSPSTVSKA